MYRICTCPSCHKRFVTKLHITNQESITSTMSTETVRYILENITIQTIACDGELEEGIQNSLRSLIPDEKLYASIMQRVHEVFETRI